MPLARYYTPSRRASLRAATCIVLSAALACVSCREEESVGAIPVEDYIRPETPAVYASPSQESNDWRPDFTDISAAAGIDFRHVSGASGKKWMPETIGGGGAFMDCDGDTLPDVLLVNSTYWPGEAPETEAPGCQLYRNRGDGTFENLTDVSGLAGLSFYGMGPAIADYDGDGDEDIYLTAVGRNYLLQNDGADPPAFTDVAESAGVAFSAGDQEASPWEWSTAALWFDYDRDGDLDLFVGNYVRWTPETDIWSTLDGTTKAYTTPEKYSGESCTLFRNDGDGAFTDVTRAAGVYNPDGKTMSAVADDFNDDGWPDLVVTNDRQPNFLYINRQDGTFADEALLAGVAYDENGLTRAGMGVSVADPGNDSKRCIAIGNFSGEPVSLYTQMGMGTFIDRAGPLRLSRPTNVSLTFGLLFDDFNLDGYEDLLLANGHIEPEIELVREDWHFEQPPQLFLNNTEGRYFEVTAEAGDPFTEPVVGRGLATADIDNDGDLDVLLLANNGPAKLLRNNLRERCRPNVVRIQLAGHEANPKAIGARLAARTNATTQTRFIRTGGSYLSQSELVATFGLGDAHVIDRLQIQWPDGTADTLENLPAETFYTIQQGTGILSRKPLD